MKKERDIQKIINNTKKAIAVTAATAVVTTGCAVGAIIHDIKEDNKPVYHNAGIEQTSREEEFTYRPLEELRKVKLPTYTQMYNGKEETFVREEDVLALCREFKYAIQDYYVSRGAKYWTNNDTKQFWPNDIEYWITAMASAESDFRIYATNDKGCKGLLGIKKDEVLKSIDGWANNKTIWGENIPYINCNPDEVDEFNPVWQIEIVYNYIGYHLVNGLKKDIKFDYKGKEYCIWDYAKFTPARQIKLLVATHFWGYGNLTTSALGVNEHGYTLSTLENSQYVKRVTERYNQIIERNNENALVI